MTQEEREELRRIHTALDQALGDSDFEHFETEEAQREHDPVGWAAMRLAKLAFG